ncbi:MAG: EAL domain-containing protein [Bosea sp. (in: a-proteobacteria)]|uniref:putative bifunctional diguanylate cyclase/phosphodiesterase n=1 Tax=Bosea sp. (in: a-proteobacteria) TaxID=1871050 RepID=UPI002732A5EC|nr:EAL domain-containing protein [Bosea sp. (in: a-proteobacteria)]MDP3256777.1 EAL domain-containing protein [Bosea sp. (in: a-proteobacteria)]MDP3317895.1 EAL domain-containing protein [Bosea sp. (in: a-proteobacteria)]
MKELKQSKPADSTKLPPRFGGSGDRGSDTRLRSLLPTLVEEFCDGVAIARVSAGNAPLLYVNKAFERLTGYARDEALGKDCRYLQGNDREQPEIARIAAAIKAAEAVDVTLRNQRKDGSVFWNSLSLRPFTISGELLYLGILRDASATRQTEIALDRAANLDGATGCLNRQSFLVSAERRFATRDGPVLIVKLDVIGFHDINAGYGFDVGDALLMETGRRLRETGAALVARIGANEFALAFEPPTEESGPEFVAEVCAALAPDFVIPGANVSLRFAIGYAQGKAEGKVISLIRNAGAALHAAKAAPLSGPRRFRRADEDEARNRVQLTRELKAAAAGDQFFHHFQPQIDLTTGEWVGAEALIRWNHPLFGILPPGRFIEAAERTGLLLDLGERGLAAVAAFARRINSGRQRPLRFSVNVSATEFLHRDMAEIMERVIRQAGVDPAWLTLEITESMFLNDTPGVLDAFRRLRDLGVGLSVDDFGTGYSNLRLLEVFPVTEIKIDRSFVAELASSQSKIVIVRAIIDLGRALGVAVVAEGVETEAQRALLAGMGCPIGQGFLFGPPVGAGDFAAGLAQACPDGRPIGAGRDGSSHATTSFGSLLALHPPASKDC